VSTAEPLIACAGCGAAVPGIDGPTHRYLGASAGCWAVFGEVLAREYSDSRFFGIHRLTVDTYAVQHPGVPSRQSIQSVAVHLISLYLTLERGFRPEAATAAMRSALRHKEEFVWLTPPSTLGRLTILDVRAARDVAEHITLVRHWAESTWEAWAPHHGLVRSWAALAESRRHA
jgi:hypothetical protein